MRVTVGARAEDWPGTQTGLLAVLGHPVGHSLSPVLHNAGLRALGLDLVYLAVDVAPAGLAEALAGLAPLGFTGVNVTVPHKQAVISACATLDADASATGAVNTIVVASDGLHGHNTDTVGFLDGVPDDLGVGRAVVLGAGGAARAVVVALAGRGWDVTIVARRLAQAVEVASLPAVQRPSGGPVAVALDDLDGVHAAVTGAALVVNATSLGLRHERLPDPFMALAGGQVAYDLVYNPLDTPFLVAAGEAGARVVDGLEMLVGQAAVAQELWTGRRPDRTLMRDAARRALAATS